VFDWVFEIYMCVYIRVSLSLIVDRVERSKETFKRVITYVTPVCFDLYRLL